MEEKQFVSCGPWIGDELKGVYEDKRHKVPEDPLYVPFEGEIYDDSRTCNEKCPYWEECWKELGWDINDEEFKKFKSKL